MILAYGNYRHALHEAGVVIERQTLLSSAGVSSGVRERWLIDGRLHGDTPAKLTTAIRQMETAYAKPGQNATLYLADGVTKTAHALISADALGGVRVTRPPSFPEREGGDYSTFRTYSIVLEAEFPQKGEVPWLDYEESLHFSDGGPRWIYLPTLIGKPLRQQVQQRTPYRVVQRGRAVGQLIYPTPSAPIWPSAWHQELGGVSRKLPRRPPRGTNRQSEYEVTWEYHFEASEPLVGNPSLPRR